MRTHYCGLIDESLVGQTVTLCGWVNTLRLQSHVAFVDLRDHEGIAQVVVERDNYPADPAQIRAAGEGLRDLQSVASLDREAGLFGADMLPRPARKLAARRGVTTE